MRRTRFFLAGTLSLCLAVGVGLIGCGGDEGTLVEIDFARLCNQSLQAMNSPDCRDTAYADVDDLKVCFVDCGPEDGPCLDACLAVPGSGFSACSGDVEFLFSGECGICYDECGFDFVRDESELGCLFDPNPATTGTDCLDDLYACVEAC